MSWLDRILHRPPSRPSGPSSGHMDNPSETHSRSSDGPDAFAVGMALLQLFAPGTLDQRYRVLEQQRAVLLTDKAIATMVERGLDNCGTDPVSAAFYFTHADLLDSARRIGLPAAWNIYLSRVSDGYPSPASERLLAEAQDEWMLSLSDPEPRIQRRVLEAHPELLGYGGLALFQLKVALLQQTYGAGLSKVQQNDLNALWNLLFAAHSRGGDTQAIRDVYVNQFGGFALDIPDWLERVIEQDTALRGAHGGGRSDQTARVRITLWQHAIERAMRESANIQPPVLAEMHVYLQHAYNEARGPDKQQQREIACLSFALQTYTEARYPYPWALAQNALGSVYDDFLQGDIAQNKEKAIACFHGALRVFTEQGFPGDWAKTQNYLGLVYRDRIQGNREENQEQAILFYQAALRVFSEQDTPRDWAMVQTNLGTLFLERLQGYKVNNQSMAIAYFQAALRVFTEQAFPIEWATTQNNLGNVLSTYHGGDVAENRRQAIACYQAALRVRTEQHFPVEWATMQNNLGGVYSRYTGEDQAENQERAIPFFQASLRVFTEHDFPRQWARSQYNLGHIYSESLHGSPAENREKAIDYFQASLRVYTRQAFPELHRTAELDLAACAAADGMWELAYSSFVSARQAEDDLLALAAGVKEVDTILSGGEQAATYEAFVLVRLGRYAEAIEAVERGRARGLAAAHLLHTSDPQRIRDPHLRERYLLHRTALQQAQAAVQQATDPPLVGKERLTRAAALRQARAAFDETVATIRVTKDPADFLYDDFSSETIARILSEKPAAHGLIYLLATPWGGMALSALNAPSAQGGQGIYSKQSTRFTVLELPMLTLDALRKRISNAPSDASYVLGGYGYAQESRGLVLLSQGWDGTSFASCAEQLHTFCQQTHQESTLDAAAQEIRASARFRAIVEVGWNELSEGQEAYLEMVFNQRFLHHELRASLEWLAEVALRPLAGGLQQEGIVGVTIIPCGLLAAFPLLAAPLEMIDGRTVTLADRYIASVTPNARTLLHSANVDHHRQGVASLGNPYPSHQSLSWGEAEALTLAELGGDATRAAIQYDADRAHLSEMLRTARVVDVSSHGIAADDYLQSRLLLANHEYLTLADALNGTLTDLHGLRLLILSACQTAIPDIRGAPDEVRSLAVGMLQAGAEAVLASLWPVDDKATYLLMVRFAQEWFPRMETEPPAAALARAQLWLRTVTNQELQTWQATTPFPESFVSPSKPVAEMQEAAGLAPVMFSRSVDAEHHSISSAWPRYSVQDAEQILQEVALKWTQEGGPAVRPYADPYFWAGFQLYGW